MIREHAEEIARRILELWPTATAVQIGVAAKGLLANEYTYQSTKDAIDAMYLNGVKFFEWGELRSRIVVVYRVDPLTLPNSVESQRKRRMEERAVMQQCQRDKEAATAYVDALGADEIVREWELWMATMGSTPAAQDWYAKMFTRGTVPIGFKLWLFEKKTGRLVGAA